MAADSWTILNVGVDGDAVDMQEVTYGGAPTERKRSRTVISGSVAAAIADVVNANPDADAYALPVRVIGERAATATTTAVTMTNTTPVQLLAANADRRGFIIQNQSTTRQLFLIFDGTTTALESGGLDHVVVILDIYSATDAKRSAYVHEGPIFTGAVHGAYGDADTTEVNVTELT